MSAVGSSEAHIYAVSEAVLALPGEAVQWSGLLGVLKQCGVPGVQALQVRKQLKDRLVTPSPFGGEPVEVRSQRRLALLSHCRSCFSD